MKRINIYLGALLSIFAVSSCGLTELDNYDEPNAEVHGSVWDIADPTNSTLVEQDISSGGTIEYVEDYIKGVTNPSKQTTTYMQNGTYRNSRLFAGEYLYFLPINSNFIVTDTLKSWPKPASGAATDRVVLSKGDNEINWSVEPNCRIKDLTIVDDKVNKQIVATFRVEKSSQLPSNYVNSIGLYCHMTQGVCGNPARIYSVENTDFNGTDKLLNPNTFYTLKQPYGTSGSSRLVNGQKYFFRVGARVNTSASKFNYLPEQRFLLEW